MKKPCIKRSYTSGKTWVSLVTSNHRIFPLTPRKNTHALLISCIFLHKKVRMNAKFSHAIICIVAFLMALIAFCGILNQPWQITFYCIPAAADYEVLGLEKLAEWGLGGWGAPPQATKQVAWGKAWVRGWNL